MTPAPHTIEEIGRMMDALDIWDVLKPCCWGVKLYGSAIPTFILFIADDAKPVKMRILLFHGWQTLGEFVLMRRPGNNGIFITPMEITHDELVIIDGGHQPMLYHYETGYVPGPLTDSERRATLARVLWEAYGVMLRIETDRTLTMRFADKEAMFCRMEKKDGTWTDEPLAIVAPHIPDLTFAVDPEDIRKAKDLPIAGDWAVAVDFSSIIGLQTRDPRPRCVYELLIVDEKAKCILIGEGVILSPDRSLREIYASFPGQFLKDLIRLGRIPGEVKVRNARAYHALQKLCLDLPFKLSFHDTLPILDHAENAIRRADRERREKAAEAGKTSQKKETEK